MINKSLWRRLSAAKPGLLQDPYLAAELRSDPMIRQSYPDPADAIEGYLRFLYLAAVMPGGAVPNKAVDAVWHAHLSHTRAYATFCRKVIWRTIHHTPSPRSSTGPDAATRERFRATQAAERQEFSAASLAARDSSDIGGEQVLVCAFGILVALIGVIILLLGKTVAAEIMGILVACVGAACSIGSLTGSPAATHPPTKEGDAKHKGGQTTGSSGGDGGDTFLLSGLPGSASGEGCAPGGTVGDGGGDNGNNGSDDGSSCSSCGGD